MWLLKCLQLSQQTKSIQESLQQTHDKVTQMRSLHNTILSSPKSDPSIKYKFVSHNFSDCIKSHILKLNLTEYSTGVKEMLEKLTQTVTKEMNQIVKDLKGSINLICWVE